MKAPSHSTRSDATTSESLRASCALLRRAAACALAILLLCNAALAAPAGKAGKRAAAKAAKVTSAKVSAVRPADAGRVSFKLTVRGEGFGSSADAVSLALANADDGEEAVAADEATVESVEPTKIVAALVAPPGPYSLLLKIGKTRADTSAVGALAVARPAARRPPPSPVEIETPEVSAYASEGALRKYALVIKRKDGALFETDPRLVSVSLTPAGAADITIRRVTPTRIEADFWAPEDYKVRDAGVTVYDRDDPQSVVASSDVSDDEGGGAAAGAAGAAGAQTASASAGPGPKTKALPGDEQPEITSTAIVFLQRAYGIGRLKIEGKNFGSYEAPPLSAEEYLLCYEPLARQALVRALAESEHPYMDAQQKYEDQRCAYKDTDRAAWQTWRAQVERNVKVALVPRNTDLRIEQTKILYIDDKMIDVYFEFNRYYRFSEPLRLASATVTVKKPFEVDSKPTQKQKQGAGQTAGAHAQGGVINAMMAGGGEEVKPTPAPVERRTFIATKEVGTRQDENLEYRYTVLDSASAETLFGRGVAHNFYVIQLSVTNKGDKKMAVPLASIQAEVEWAYGPSPKAGENQGQQTARSQGVEKKKEKTLTTPASFVAQDDAKGGEKGGAQDDSNGAAAPIPFSKEEANDYYEEGPATVAPLPLPAVTAFFDDDAKVNGKKAKFFNITDGLATLGSSLIPFFGPGFKDAHVAFTGGLVPGIRRGLGDLSSQQLQTLTALSWQGVEVVAAKGGSVEKFVFIQRGDQVFSPGFGERLRKTIKNIEGMEVIGFEVVESDAKRATLAGQQ